MSVIPPPVLPFAEDANQLAKEYGSFVHNITLGEADQSKVYIETKEHATLTVQLTAAGWKILNVEPKDAPLQVRTLEGQTYEGAEAFLMAASDEFRRLWHTALMEKLSALESFREED